MNKATRKNFPPKTGPPEGLMTVRRRNRNYVDIGFRGAESFIVPEFFDLSTGVLGDVAQKCSNYRFRLAIVGDFDAYPSAALRAYIRESNRGGLVLFANTLDAALAAFGGGA